MVAFSKIALVAFVGSAAATALPTPLGPLKIFHELQQIPSSWTSSGAASKEAKIHAQIGLKQPNIDKLQTKLLDISNPESANYGNWLSRDELHKLVAPPAANVAAVTSWLASHGITDTTQASPDWIEFTAPVSTMEALLNAKYETFTHDSQGIVVPRTQRYSIPELLHDVIDMVTPMTAFYEIVQSKASSPKKKPKASPAKVNGCDTSKIDPKCIKKLYNVDYEPTGKANIGATGLNDERASHSDYSKFGDTFVDGGLTDFQDVSVAGAVNNASTDPYLQMEGNLDIQYTGGLANPNNNTYIDCGDEGSTDAFANFASYLTSNSDAPTSVSTSYGGEEKHYATDYMDRVCNEFMKAGSLGISVFFSSGDGGVGGNNEATCNETFYPTWPASCPWATAVGGTQFADNGTEEVAVFGPADSKYSGSPGGGFSSHFTAPSYQSADTAGYVKFLNGTYDGKFNSSGRGIPDIALVAVNYQYVLLGNVTSDSGTSASAPAFAALVSILNDYRLSIGKSTLGFINPLLYSNTSRSALRDVKHGNNHGCDSTGYSATAGWDPASGLGSIDFAKFRATL